MIKQEDFMLEAINEALKAKKKYEVPVGAIVVDNKKNIIARAHNLVETNNDTTCHAERLAIEKALKTKNTKYLNDCDIWVTLKPCEMCLGMIKLTRIKRLYYGAEEKNIQTKSFQKKSLEVYGDISARKCEYLLKDFFQKLR